MQRRWARWGRSAIILGLTAGVAGALGASGREQGPSLVSLLRYGPGVTNHPVNVVPTPGLLVPADWPLSPAGAITCLTCHSSLPSPGGSDGSSLRGFDDGPARPREFCARCHDGGGERSAASMHWLAVGVAHVPPEANRVRYAGVTDVESRRCLACHDGVSASERSSTTPFNRGPGSRGDKRRNHPIGVAYPDYPTPGASVRLRPAASLPPTVRLPERRVSCVSCHDLYSATRYHLTVTVEESTLCFTCHDMD